MVVVELVLSCPAFLSYLCQRPIILAADQLLMGGLDREMRHKEKLWKKDVESKNPFSPVSRYFNMNAIA